MSPLDAFSRVKVLCLGDVMLDRFISGAVNRISPESPVPVMSILENRAVPGGAANVARNVAALGGRCTLIGVVGRDAAADELARAISTVSGINPRLVTLADRPTTEKIRFVAQGQHMLRADQENSRNVEPAAEQELVQVLREEIGSHDVLVLSDYAKGVLTDAVVTEAIRIARDKGRPVVVDPKSSRMERYSGATVITPNTKEAHEATGIDPAEDDAKALLAGSVILERAALAAVLVTRAHRGMTLVMREGGHQHIKASAREVFDVVGAGDTVVATLALCLGASQPMEYAAMLANTAAGLVVGKRGTATVSHSELLDELHHQDQGGLHTLTEKVLDIQAAAEMVAAWRQDGLSVGFTNGCFDLLHVGHLSILGFAKSQCGRLIVGLNSDASVRRLKGPERPINPQQDRAMVLAGLAAVDAVVVFDDDTPLELIRQLLPDVLVKGADYTVDQIVGAQDVLERGGRVVTCPLVAGRSTTRVVQLLREGQPS